MSFINLRVNKELEEKRPRMWGSSEVNREKERKKAPASSLSESAKHTSGDAVGRPLSGRDLMANTNMHLYERLMATCQT